MPIHRLMSDLLDHHGAGHNGGGEVRQLCDDEIADGAPFGVFDDEAVKLRVVSDSDGIGAVGAICGVHHLCDLARKGGAIGDAVELRIDDVDGLGAVCPAIQPDGQGLRLGRHGVGQRQVLNRKIKILLV